MPDGRRHESSSALRKPRGRSHSAQWSELYCSPAGKLFLDVFKVTLLSVARRDPRASLSWAGPGAS